VAKPDKLFGQVGNDALGATLETRGDALNERSHLGDFHKDLYSPGNYERVQRNKSSASLRKGWLQR